MYCTHSLCIICPRSFCRNETNVQTKQQKLHDLHLFIFNSEWVTALTDFLKSTCMSYSFSPSRLDGVECTGEIKHDPHWGTGLVQVVVGAMEQMHNGVIHSWRGSTEGLTRERMQSRISLSEAFMMWAVRATICSRWGLWDAASYSLAQCMTFSTQEELSTAAGSGWRHTAGSTDFQHHWVDSMRSCSLYWMINKPPDLLWCVCRQGLCKIILDTSSL